MGGEKPDNEPESRPYRSTGYGYAEPEPFGAD
jgi:hypothetical protein